VKRSELNQQEYCEARGIPLKAFGNRRAKFKAEPEPPLRVLGCYLNRMQGANTAAPVITQILSPANDRESYGLLL
jgi:hypothetical protein